MDIFFTFLTARFANGGDILCLGYLLTKRKCIKLQQWLEKSRAMMMGWKYENGKRNEGCKEKEK